MGGRASGWMTDIGIGELRQRRLVVSGIGFARISGIRVGPESSTGVGIDSRRLCRGFKVGVGTGLIAWWFGGPGMAMPELH